MGDFYKRKSSKDGFHTICIQCLKVRHANNYGRTKNYHKDRCKAYREANKERLKAYDIGRYPERKKQRAEIKEKMDIYRREYERERRKDPVFRMKKNMRFLLWQAIKRTKVSKRSKTIQRLGIPFDQFKIYIESKFQDGMSWDNYGLWHLDHIKPLASFDLTDERSLNEACHYLNLQPLWAEENQRKHKKIEYNPSTSAQPLS